MTGVLTLQPIIVTDENSFSIETIFFIIWILIVFALFITIIIRTLIFSHNLSGSKSIQIDSILPSNIKVYQSDRIQSPLVIGFFRFKIILPESWEQYSREELKLIIFHELAHIRQKDQWINLLQNIVQAIHFFNPFVWLLTEKIRQINEMTGDDLTVYMAGINRKTYMKSLINISEMSFKRSASLPLSLAFSETYYLIKNRINYQLSRKEGLVMDRLSIKQMFLVVLLTFIMVCSAWQCNSNESQEVVTEQQVTLDKVEESSVPPVQGENIYEFSEVDVKPELIKKVSPEYPAEARKAGISGKVVVTVTIDENGDIIKAKVLAPTPEQEKAALKTTENSENELTPIVENTFLERAAINAAKQCKFSPAMKDGKPVKVEMNIPYKFKLN